MLLARQLLGVSFKSCTTAGNGGAVGITGNCAVVASNTQFTACTAAAGNGAFCVPSSQVALLEMVSLKDALRGSQALV